MRALLLPVGEDLYAVELHRAREVAELPALTRLPASPPAVLGVFNLRGEIVPLFDTRQLVGLGAGGAPSHVAVVQTALGPAGLATTGVGEPVELGEAIDTTDTPGTVSTHRVRDRVAVLLDPDLLFAAGRPGG